MTKRFCLQAAAAAIAAKQQQQARLAAVVQSAAASTAADGQQPSGEVVEDEAMDDVPKRMCPHCIDSRA